MISDIHSGKLQAGEIDEGITYLTHRILMDGISRGLKVDFDNVDYSSENGAKLKALQTHVFRFSACKNYTEVEQMSRMLVKNGQRLSFEEFRSEASKIDQTFNGSWLRTEYDQAQVTATRIADYNRMDKNRDLYPTWQYKTRADGHVREAHQSLHNKKLAANDPAWESIYPPNGWNCRCWVEPLSENPPDLSAGQKAIEELRKTIINPNLGISEWDNMVRHGFDQNPAITGNVFPKNHPFFRNQEKAAVKRAVTKFEDKFEDTAINRISKAKTLKAVADELRTGLANLGHEGVKIELQSISLERAKIISSRLIALCSEYRVSATWEKFSTKKTVEFDGYVTTWRHPAISRKVMNVTERVNDKRVAEVASTFSRCDAENLKYSTIDHEFMHMLWVEAELTPAAKEFTAKAIMLKNAYVTEYFGYAKGSRERETLSLGDYAMTSTSEFIAEGFQEYRNKSAPGKYALLIGKLVDESFKK